MCWHSIIIPFCDRLVQKLPMGDFYQRDYLRWTLWGIERSAHHCGLDGYEVLVVDSSPSGAREGSALDDVVSGSVRWLRAPASQPYYNKPAAINFGIKSAGGRVVTFLDADVLVGCRWMDAAQDVGAGPTRLCYRVRQLEKNAIQLLSESGSEEVAALLVDGWFARYSRFVRAAECYGDPDRSVREGEEPSPFGPHVFGNSQFSVAAHWLKRVSADEAYAGRGWEDMSFVQEIRELADKEKGGYWGLIMTEPDFSILHLNHDSPLTPDGYWNNTAANLANARRFRAKMNRPAMDP